MDKVLYITEQHNRHPLANVSDDIMSLLDQPVYRRSFYYNSESTCYCLHNDAEGVFVDSSYYIGVDWLVLGKAAIYVEPKMNVCTEVDFLGMLIQSLEEHENLDHLQDLLYVDFNSPWIEITGDRDRLSPFLIIRFLMLLQRIVKKGLMRSYYSKVENLDGRIKGKILVERQLKENIVRSRMTKTICRYDEFGFNTLENQFLKLVLEFVSSYLNQGLGFSGEAQCRQLRHMVHLCRPAFEHIDVLKDEHRKIRLPRNRFYSEYEEAVKVGEMILKRFSFNISKTTDNSILTPPFWVDMSKLFELYVFRKLKRLFPKPGAVTYHDSFRGGKQTDILIRANGFKCVIDCKYKPAYKNQDPSLEDKRQLAGYVRLKAVYDRLEVPYTELIKGLIVYSHQDCEGEIEAEGLFRQPIAEYIDFYKLGISLPEIVPR